MSSENSSIKNGSTANLFSHLATPNPFSPDWHHQFGAKLCVFPRYVVLPLQDEGIRVNAQFWPDLATFVEGDHWSALMYYPGASRASVCVLHWQDVPRWEAVRFDDEDVVARASGSSYEELVSGIGNLVIG